MLGLVRVSTAYEFYEAVRQHLIFVEQTYTNKAKPPFEATNYMLFYFAADAEDAEGKHCDYVMDRTQMWDCTKLPGSSTSYDFVGMPRSLVKMRTLPCPCGFCCAGAYDYCTNIDIVNVFVDRPMRQIHVACPERLQEPLNNYTVTVLKAFMREHGKRIPGGAGKPALIALVTAQLPDYIDPAAAPN
jgi:hypothetical protein